jgi:hypothetical protein
VVLADLFYARRSDNFMADLNDPEFPVGWKILAQAFATAVLFLFFVFFLLIIFGSSAFF